MKDVWIHDIVNGITVARAYAELLSAKHPEVIEPVQKLIEELTHVQQTVEANQAQLARNLPTARCWSRDHVSNRLC